MKPLIHFIFLLFFTIQLCCSKFHYGCPTDQKLIDNLSPCKCSQTFERANWKTVVTCSRFNESIKLKTSLNAIHTYKIDELLLYGLNMKYLPQDVFFDNNVHLVEIETVTIQSSNIEDIAEPGNSNRTFFTGLGTSMRQLRIESSGSLSKFNWKRLVNSLTINNAPKVALKNLLFYHNEMAILPNTFDTFGLNNIELERVILQSNGIKKIDAHLHFFSKMTLLDLSSNQIDSIDRLFENAQVQGIQTIILKNNNLTILKESSPFWKFIESQNNSLGYIDLRENPIDCKCQNIKWATNKKLNLNSIIDAKCNSPPEVSGKSIDSCI